MAKLEMKCGICGEAMAQIREMGLIRVDEKTLQTKIEIKPCLHCEGELDRCLKFMERFNKTIEWLEPKPTRPAIMPDYYRIVYCENCPFSASYDDNAIYCNFAYSIDGPSVGICTRHFHVPLNSKIPDWCPLRKKQQVVIELANEAK